MNDLPSGPGEGEDIEVDRGILPRSLPVAARPSVLIADNRRLLADMLSAMLAAEFDVLRCVSDGGALLVAAEELRPDIALVDLDMPCLAPSCPDGLQAAEELHRRQPECRLVLLTSEPIAQIAAHAFARGARGFLLTTDSAEEVLRGLRTIAGGGRHLSSAIAGGDLTKLRFVPAATTSPLSPREREVLGLAASGLPMKAIARHLGIAPRTVAFHKYRGMATLGLRHQADLVRFALERGWLTHPNPPAPSSSPDD